jgi:signal transduction histidine kinase
MLRRLFFLFPDEAHAQSVVDQLLDLNIDQKRIHKIAKNGVKLRTLPKATIRQKADTAYRVEWFLWRANLLLFLLAFLMLCIMLVRSEWLLAIVALIIMLATFFAGASFVTNVPDVHLTEFTDALSHGEILLMVDVPVGRVAEIEAIVHRQHPEATLGGVSWTVDAFGI